MGSCNLCLWVGSVAAVSPDLRPFDEGNDGDTEYSNNDGHESKNNNDDENDSSSAYCFVFFSSFAAMMISSRRRYHSPPKKRKDLSTCKKYFIFWLSWCFDRPASSATCSVVFETLQSQRLINWFLFFVRSKPLFSWSVASETWKKK